MGVDVLIPGRNALITDSSQWFIYHGKVDLSFETNRKRVNLKKKRNIEYLVFSTLWYNMKDDTDERYVELLKLTTISFITKYKIFIYYMRSNNSAL